MTNKLSNAMKNAFHKLCNTVEKERLHVGANPRL